MLSKLSIIKWSKLHQPQRERGKNTQKTLKYKPYAGIKVTIASTRIKFNQFGKSNLCDSCLMTSIFSCIIKLFWLISFQISSFWQTFFCPHVFVFTSFFPFVFSCFLFFSPKDLHIFRSHAEIYEWGKINVEILLFWKVAVMKL